MRETVDDDDDDDDDGPDLPVANTDELWDSRPPGKRHFNLQAFHSYTV